MRLGSEANFLNSPIFANSFNVNLQGAGQRMGVPVAALEFEVTVRNDLTSEQAAARERKTAGERVVAIVAIHAARERKNSGERVAALLTSERLSCISMAIINHKFSLAIFVCVQQ